MLGINILGGIAVLFSYAQGLLAHPVSKGSLWGNIPDSVRFFYVISMFVAAAGYFFYTYFLLFRVNPQEARISGRFGFNVFSIIYVLILAPSALWMPLTFEMIAHPSQFLWLEIRLILWCIGLSSIILIIALLALRPRKPRMPYCLAIAGSTVFAVHTAILDGIIWVIYFPPGIGI